jgi:hypothetical protein
MGKCINGGKMGMTFNCYVRGSQDYAYMERYYASMVLRGSKDHSEPRFYPSLKFFATFFGTYFLRDLYQLWPIQEWGFPEL